MLDDASDSPLEPAPLYPPTQSPSLWRTALFLGISSCIGQVVGVALTVAVTCTLIPTILPARDMVEVFHELNGLRQQIDQLNADQKLKDVENVATIRQALSDVASKVHSRESGPSSISAPAQKPGVSTEKPRVARGWDPLAEVDEEIKRLEETQRVLNTILDIFTPKSKNRSSSSEPPE